MVEFVLLRYSVVYIVESLYLFISFSYVCFVALRPKSTAMEMTGRSVHLTTLFPGQA